MIPRVLGGKRYSRGIIAPRGFHERMLFHPLTQAKLLRIFIEQMNKLWHPDDCFYYISEILIVRSATKPEARSD